ncbi:MAG: hypothetical protein RIT43_325 [Bacteroidota bacterium]
MLQVVAGVIVRKNSVLCCRKGKTKLTETSYKFEFPGGKIQEGESPEAALKRELLEELGVDVKILKPSGSHTHAYSDLTVCIHFYLCELEQDEPIAREHVQLIWSTQENIRSLEWLAADLPMVERIAEQGLESLFS